MTNCDQINHLGKFNSRRDSALYGIGLDGWADAYTGDSVEWHYHAALILLDADLVRDDTDGVSVRVPAGFYIVRESSTGVVDVFTFPTEGWARETFASLEDQYAIFSNQEETP